MQIERRDIRSDKWRHGSTQRSPQQQGSSKGACHGSLSPLSPAFYLDTGLRPAVANGFWLIRVALVVRRHTEYFQQDADATGFWIISRKKSNHIFHMSQK
jgi:hypothetical protein